MDLHLPLTGSGGRRHRIEQALREAIRTGRLATGTPLPPTRALAAELGLSRGTVTAAYDQLVAEGYLVARQGAGTRVAGLPRHVPATSAPAQQPGEPVHDLRPGVPDLGSFPTTAWVRSVSRAVAAAPAEAFGYADPRGRIELRRALADYLGRTRGVSATPETIIVTTGYVQALALLTRVLAEQRRGTIAMEDPGLAYHREVVARWGGRVVPLPVDDLGADAGALSAGPAVHAAVVTPAHQYPTGVTLHPTRRRELVDWARARDGLVIEDDYDGEFRYDRKPVGALQGTAPEHVAYIGTASKTLAPGVRLAWLVAPPSLLEPLCELRRHLDHHSEVVGQLALADLIAGHGYDRHIRARRLAYRRRRDLLLGRLARLGELLPGAQVRGVAAGLQALIALPDGGPGETDVLRHAAANGLAVGTLADAWHPTGAARGEGLVVGYGTPRDGAYPAALAALERVLRATARDR